MLKIDHAKFTEIEKSDFPEIVERKGVGHPDSICDAAADLCSRMLCKYYYENYMRYYHHNVDKAALVGGIARPEFGGGKILEPQYFLIVGRAINQIFHEDKLEYIPVATICLDACKKVVSDAFRNIDLSRDIQFDYAVKPGSIDLTGVFEESDVMEQVPLANDTSFGVGFAPLSDCETITLETERMLNSDKFKEKCPGSGEDIKVMSQRVGNNVDITIANAMVSKYILDKDEYINYTNQIKDATLDLANKLIPERDVNVSVNVGDNIEQEIMYLTITGGSSEAGDDGEVGRGNRANGLITPCRTMSLEAVCGKNPINHVGKIYNVLANNMAKAIYERGQGDIIEAHVKLLSQIGRPITDPWINSISLIPADNVNFSKVEKIAEEVSQDLLSRDNIISLRERLIEGKEQTW
ncbi:MAG: methionine adenosyltransferase [Candidatus Lokiarchaeota archaeon]|nr:methionine adenosyltransferase [Candidatus Lokiarchaeota archaeon]MBD3202226.1 methionine adenosyltransferase [Candidatus Lokiarchaeota archaeon]